MSDDPVAMYYLVRKDVPLSRNRAMALAGAGAVRCADELGDQPCFGPWRERPRKVALRASPGELEELSGALPGIAVAGTLVCLAPLRKSDRPPLLEALQPFTDAPRPTEPDEPEPDPLVYVVRRGVIKTAGKAMAQAGHAALAAVEKHGERLAEWRERGLPGVARAADGEVWEELRRHPDAVVVEDAGHTQVAPGAEAGVALPPGSDVPDLEPLD